VDEGHECDEHSLKLLEAEREKLKRFQAIEDLPIATSDARRLFQGRIFRNARV
jgi:hypothetical protein